MTTPRAVGIDLGTTYSAVACLDEAGRSAIVRNSEGQILTPSVVFFDRDEIVVGKAAKQVASVESARVAECVKRDMGSAHYSRPINGQNMPPEVIQACILRKLKQDAAAVVGADFKVVITVPAYFDEPRRKATADSGEMAGLDVLDIVNEPTAAALAFGEQLGYLSPTGAPMQPMKVLVYDLGGGTFDVTIIDLSPGDIRTIATDGDVQLGGRDWDDALAGFAAQAFQSQYGVDVRQDPAAAGKLMIEVEDAKHTLSQRDHAVIRVEHQGNAIDVPVTRQQFELMTEGLLERTSFTTRQVIATAGLTWQDISRVLLVGGSTRMPMVMNMIQQLSGIAPDRSINPDEAVARGAALFAGYQLRLQGAAGGSQFKVTDVNAHSLGLQGIAEETLMRENVIVISKNTPLPAKVERQFVTQRDGQRSIIVRVLEGESKQPDLCSQIGRSVLRDLPPGLPKGYPINVIFSYATNGRLNVEAVLSGTQRKVRIELEREQGMTSAQINRWRQLFGGEVGEPSADALLREAFQDPNYSTPQKQPRPAAEATRSANKPPVPQAAAPGTTATLTPAATGHANPSAAGPPTSPSPAGTSPAASMPDSGPAQLMGQQSATDRMAEERRLRLIRRTVLICGHVVFATLGLAGGYWILCWLKPEADILGFFK